MDGAAAVEIGLGRPHLNCHSKPLEHFINTEPYHVQAYHLWVDQGLNEDGLIIGFYSLHRTFSLGRRQMSFMWNFVFLFVTAWYMGVKLEQ